MAPVATGLPVVMSPLMGAEDIGLLVGMFPLTVPAVFGRRGGTFHQMEVVDSGLQMGMSPPMVLAGIGRLQVMFLRMGAEDTGARERKTVAGESLGSNHPPTASHSMGFFRFRRSIKIAPGIRWNFGKKSSSVSFGGRGAHYTVGTSGSRATVGIPGTGLSYTETSAHSSQPSGKNSGCVGCLGQILLLLLLLGGISMCVRSDKQGSISNPTTSSNPPASSTPSPQSTPNSIATPPPFPERRYWPREVRLLKAVRFSGSVSGGTVQSTISAGTILPARLSADHQRVTVRMNDLTASIPLADTDFLKRADERKSRARD